MRTPTSTRTPTLILLGIMVQTGPPQFNLNGPGHGALRKEGNIKAGLDGETPVAYGPIIHGRVLSLTPNTVRRVRPKGT